MCSHICDSTDTIARAHIQLSMCISTSTKTVTSVIGIAKVNIESVRLSLWEYMQPRRNRVAHDQNVEININFNHGA